MSKCIRLTLIYALLASLNAFAALDSGDKAPVFGAKAVLAGRVFDYSLKEALQRGPVVVYFYPSAYTRGCNIQAHEFSVNMEAFNAAGASVIGVSLDSIDRLSDFSVDPEFCAGKLAVATDEDGSIAKSFELAVRAGRPGIRDTRGDEIDHGFIERTTFVIGRDGRIIKTITGVSPPDNVRQSLEAVRQLRVAQ